MRKPPSDWLVMVMELEGKKRRLVLLSQAVPPSYEVAVVGDGNCFYRALARALWGDESRHAEARALVVAELRAKPELYQNSCRTGEQTLGVYQKYLGQMSLPGAWADDLAVAAAARAFGLNITVLTAYEGHVRVHVGGTARARCWYHTHLLSAG